MGKSIMWFMKYEEFMIEKGLERGDTIWLRTENAEFEGMIMPHHEFSDEDILILKLKNGYNVGIAIDKVREVKVLERGRKERREEKGIERTPNLPDVAILGTGGTIASYVDYRTGAVHPAKSPSDLLKRMPELFKIANIHAEVLFSLLSEDMDVKMWQAIGEKVAEMFTKFKARGVVITHGTDTLAYTAAALSFMFPSLPGPVVLVGSQRSSDRPSSDAYLNLLSAVRFASLANLGEVCVVMHDGLDDSVCAVHRGTKVRKMHTSRRDAFKTINGEKIGLVSSEKLEIYGKVRERAKLVFEPAFEENVSLLYYYPGMKERLLREYFEGAKGVVIAGTGLGHVHSKFVPIIREYVEKGCHVVMTSQCLYGCVNMNVYSTGRELIKAGVIDGKDMLPETAYVKLMWVLAHARNAEEVRELMLKNIAGEISERREV